MSTSEKPKVSENSKNSKKGAFSPCTTLAASHFWAEWDPTSYAPEILRKDTRIYWKPQLSGNVGECVGTFFGENPGSAKSIHGLHFANRSPLVDRSGNPGDPTLRLILDTWIEAARIGVVSPQDFDYIEVLNLYYFRNATSLGALAMWNQCSGAAIYSPAVSPTSEFILLGWGNAPNHTPQAAAAINLICAHPKVLIPDSKANLWRTGGPLKSPVIPFPAQPSYFHAGPNIRRPLYVANVAQGF